jgi:hypothetical protein
MFCEHLRWQTLAGTANFLAGIFIRNRCVPRVGAMEQQLLTGGPSGPRFLIQRHPAGVALGGWALLLRGRAGLL